MAFSALKIQAGSSGVSFVITEGSDTISDQTYYGFSDNQFSPAPDAHGSLSPASFLGTNMVMLDYRNEVSPAEDKFFVIMDGNLGAAFWKSADISGYGVVLATAAAYQYNAGSDTSQWMFDILPTGWDGSGTSTVTIHKF